MAEETYYNPVQKWLTEFSKKPLPYTPKEWPTAPETTAQKYLTEWLPEFQKNPFIKGSLAYEGYAAGGVPNQKIGVTNISPEMNNAIASSFAPNDKRFEMVNAAINKVAGAGIPASGEGAGYNVPAVSKTTESMTAWKGPQETGGIEANPWDKQLSDMVDRITSLSRSIRPADSGYLGDTYKENIGAIQERNALLHMLPDVTKMTTYGGAGVKMASEAADTEYKQSMADYHRTMAGIAKNAEERKAAEDNFSTMEGTLKYLGLMAPKTKTSGTNEKGETIETTVSDYQTAAKGFLDLGIGAESPHLKLLAGGVGVGAGQPQGGPGTIYTEKDENGKWYRTVNGIKRYPKAQ